MLNKFKNKFLILIKQHGWKAALGIFLFYLIRDVSLYILLPWLVAKNLLF